MKNILYLSFLLAFVNTINAQQNVTLHINHQITASTLQMNGTIYNTGNGIYTISRLQYYVSGIQLVHDGGQLINLTGKYLLVNADTEDYNLGSFNVSNIEEIRFDIGVDSSTNHSDPSTYLAGNPLAIQNPSTHWGWTAGYMFLIIDGVVDGTNSGSPNTTMEFRAIGDQYLTNVSLNTSNATNSSGGTTTINIDADYNNLFGGVTMGTILHGSGLEIDRLMGNIGNNVFTASNLTGLKKIPSVLELSISPNPATVKTGIKYHFNKTINLSLIITDMHGRTLEKFVGLPEQGHLNIDTKQWASGVYCVSFIDSDQIITSKKIIVTQK